MRKNTAQSNTNARYETDRKPELPRWGAGRAFSTLIGTYDSSAQIKLRAVA